mmetsp:Transcript_32560/g.103821  ORF Transcript_32560/g.103821 Transcript_32560/m.103821 type:complete len:345 (-) Transcript_32560:99-1133(-)
MTTTTTTTAAHPRRRRRRRRNRLFRQKQRKCRRMNALEREDTTTDEALLAAVLRDERRRWIPAPSKSVCHVGDVERSATEKTCNERFGDVGRRRRSRPRAVRRRRLELPRESPGKESTGRSTVASSRLLLSFHVSPMVPLPPRLRKTTNLCFSMAASTLPRACLSTDRRCPAPRRVIIYLLGILVDDFANASELGRQVGEWFLKSRRQSHRKEAHVDSTNVSNKACSSPPAYDARIDSSRSRACRATRSSSSRSPRMSGSPWPGNRCMSTPGSNASKKPSYQRTKLVALQSTSRTERSIDNGVGSGADSWTRQSSSSRSRGSNITPDKDGWTSLSPILPRLLTT